MMNECLEREIRHESYILFHYFLRSHPMHEWPGELIQFYIQMGHIPQAIRGQGGDGQTEGGS